MASTEGGVGTEQILAILGAKEVEIQVLRQRVAELSSQLAQTVSDQNTSDARAKPRQAK